MENATAELSFVMEQEIQIEATPDAVFDALLGQLGEGMATKDGESMSMKLEAWPGGRWYRDLGQDQGHLWGHVQVLKRPALVELVGPMFMSYPALGHLQLRVSESGSSCVLTLKQQVLGQMKDEHREGVTAGWGHFLERVSDHAEA